MTPLEEFYKTLESEAENIELRKNLAAQEWALNHLDIAKLDGFIEAWKDGFKTACEYCNNYERNLVDKKLLNK